MTSDALAIIQMLFGSIWPLFTSFHFPGTRITPAELGFFFLFVPVLFKFLSRIFGFSIGAISMSERDAANTPKWYQVMSGVRGGATSAKGNTESGG